MTEKVNHPLHYGGDTPYEHVKVMENWGMTNNAFLYNATKYICRAGKKGNPDKVAEDTQKAMWYIRREIALSEIVRETGACWYYRGPVGELIPSVTDVSKAWELDYNLQFALTGIVSYWQRSVNHPSGVLSDVLIRLAMVLGTTI